ncbi:hypothetical protein ABIB82_002718 [Bradyrhizobium sp. i1.8.4]
MSEAIYRDRSVGAHNAAPYVAWAMRATYRYFPTSYASGSKLELGWANALRNAGEIGTL